MATAAGHCPQPVHTWADTSCVEQRQRADSLFMCKLLCCAMSNVREQCSFRDTSTVHVTSHQPHWQAASQACNDTIMGCKALMGVCNNKYGEGIDSCKMAHTTAEGGMHQAQPTLTLKCNQRRQGCINKQHKVLGSTTHTLPCYYGAFCSTIRTPFLPCLQETQTPL